MQHSRDDLLAAYRRMRTMRSFEERMHVEFAKGGVPGFVHLYAGQEASAAAICANIDDDDYFYITHRAHGPAIARGADLSRVAKEIYCRADGLCRGRGGSAHLHDVERKLIGANSGVGSGAALACGAALSILHHNTRHVAVALMGDGAVNQGVVSEAMNLAAIWKLPVLFAFENNGYAESTSAAYAIAGDGIVGRAAAFGMPGKVVDGHDYFAVYDAIREAVENCREGNGPSLVEMRQLRYYGHFEGDAQTYRPPGEVEHCRRTRDCLANFRRRVLAAGLLAEDDFDAIDRDVAQQVERAFEAAEAAPLPDLDDLQTGVYASDYSAGLS